MKKPSPLNSTTFAIGALRRASYRWIPRHKAREAAKIARNQYKCAKCLGIFGKKDTAVDHKDPVVPVTGFDGFDGFIKRLFCEVDQMQILCKVCHKEKTKKETKIRAEHRKRKKLLEN